MTVGQGLILVQVSGEAPFVETIERIVLTVNIANVVPVGACGVEVPLGQRSA